MERMQTNLRASTSQATTYPTSAAEYTLHERVGKGSSSTVRAQSELSCNQTGFKLLTSHTG